MNTQPIHLPATIGLSLVSLILLSACQPSATDDGAATANTGSECMTAPPPAIKNPTFELNPELGYPRDWWLHQHAGEKSYEISGSDGELVLNNVGKQYWLRLSQRHAVADQNGREVTFSMEVKMDLNGEGWPHSLVAGGGLQVIVRGMPPGGTSNKVALHKATMPDEPRLGQVDWRQLSHTFTVPEGAEFMEVGLLHQAHGTMWVRNPQLSYGPPTAAQCAAQQDQS